MRYFKWTMPGGEVACKAISVEHPADYSVVESAKGQNRLRQILSILSKVKVGGCPAMGDLYDMVITFDDYNKEYKLWTYTRNWPGRAGFLSGILYGYEHHRKRR